MISKNIVLAQSINMTPHLAQYSITHKNRSNLSITLLQILNIISKSKKYLINKGYTKRL